MRYRACLFDMNGVLVDDEHLHEEAFRLTLSGYGHTLTPEDYQQFFIGKTDRNGYEAYFAGRHQLPANIDELVAQKGSAYQRLAKSGVQGYPGVEEFIQELSSHGVNLAVVTSSTRAEAQAVLAGLQLRKYFSVTVAAEDVATGKPDPEGYLKGSKALGVQPHECVVVEDAPSGVRAARSAGMSCVVVRNTHTKEQIMEADMTTRALSAKLARELLRN